MMPPTTTSDLKSAGKLSGRQLEYYEKEIDSYREMLKDYTHAEQGRKDIGTW